MVANLDESLVELANQLHGLGWLGCEFLEPEELDRLNKTLGGELDNHGCIAEVVSCKIKPPDGRLSSGSLRARHQESFWTIIAHIGPSRKLAFFVDLAELNTKTS